MKALLFTAPQQCEFLEQPTPRCQPGESLIAVKAAGICGSDMHAWHGHDERRKPPLILGHEVSGLVVEGPNQGCHVTVNPIIYCGECDLCLHGKENVCADRRMIGMHSMAGGFAQYLCISSTNVVVVEKEMPFCLSALTEPTAVCLHALNLINTLGHFRPLEERRFLIVGGGAIGILCALLLHRAGASQITISETNELRRETAHSATAADVVDASAASLAEQSYHCVIDAVGSGKSRAMAMRCIASSGVFIHLGLQDSKDGFDARRLTIGEITVVGAFTYTMAEFRAALQWLSDAYLSIDKWVTEQPLSAGQQCFDSIHEGREKAAKIVLTGDS